MITIFKWGLQHSVVRKGIYSTTVLVSLTKIGERKEKR